MKNTPGPRGPSKKVQTAFASFELFFTKKTIDDIVKYTNENVKPAMERFANLLEEFDKYPHFRLVDDVDILGYFGFLYYN